VTCKRMARAAVNREIERKRKWRETKKISPGVKTNL
jgi:hypothetical protein